MATIHAFYNNEVTISVLKLKFQPWVLILKGELLQTFMHTLGGSAAVSLYIPDAGKCEF